MRSLARRARIAIHHFMRPFYMRRLRRLGVKIGSSLTIYGKPDVHLVPGGEIILGSRVVLCSDSQFTALALNHGIRLSVLRQGARLEIGDDAGLSGACVVCTVHVSIGRDALIGANVLISDTDFHPLKAEGRRHSDDVHSIGCSPINLDENVFVGANAIILKGVQIGKDSIVGAGSVVTAGSYPEGSIIAGNPAKIVGSVYQQ